MNIIRLKYILLEKPIREIKYAYQRVARGYDDSAKWGLYEFISRVSLPILKEYRNNGAGYPIMFNSREEWNVVLDKMISAFEIIIKDEYWYGINKKTYKKDLKTIKEGLSMFSKYFMQLWD
jgi:hypothetical protein